MTTHPLISELKKLKESSRYAIAQGDKYSLDDFKKYLHIEREVESRLKQIIVQSSAVKKAQLILVCGNVGDGKSHVLSYLHNEIPNEIGRFQIHNDATESHNPRESSNDTLYRLLENFKDTHIQGANTKLILAINLGTLSKFMEKYGVEFSNLADFIKQESILDNTLAPTTDFNPESYFHQINFTDYHLYSLTETGPVSATITELFQRIVATTESNVIFQAYEKIKDHPEFSRCPVRLNYEFLFSTENRELIVQLIIQAIASNKEIVSVRSILNFIHDLIVPVNLSSITEADQLTVIKGLSDIEFLKSIIPNYIFEHADLSNLFARLEDLDPCNHRDEQTDEKLLRLQSIERPTVLLAQDIQTKLYGDVLQHIQLDNINKEIISKYYLRLLFFQNREVPKNDDFKEYITWLYHFNKGNTAYFSKLYDLVEKAVFKWYGDPKKGDKVVLKVGRRQVKYRIFKDFTLAAQPGTLNRPESEILHQFAQELSVRYARQGSMQNIPIAIDFRLFKILKMIGMGYRPNRKDNNNFVYFVYFINEMTQEAHHSSLYIDEINVGKPIDYKITKNPFGDYKFELVS